MTIGACQRDDEQASMYAVVPSSKSASRFDQDLASLAKRHGLTPKLGQATDDKGHTLHVLEARGRGMRLWAENAPLSGAESPTTCGRYVEAHPDPGQYYVTAGPILPFMPASGARELATQLRHELSVLGYEVRSDAALCSSLSRSATGPVIGTPRDKIHRR